MRLPPPPSLFSLILLAASSCRSSEPLLPSTREEIAPRRLPLRGEAAASEQEFSGLAWCGDRLVLLPQYPARSGDSAFVLDRAELEAAVAAPRPPALTPRRLPLDDGGARDLPGFEGFEAIACAPSGEVWVTVEAKAAGGGMTGWLVPGRYEAASGIQLRPAERVDLPSRSGLDNKADEAVWLWQGRPWTMHEVNAEGATGVYRLDASGQRQGLRGPAIPFRVTDATEPDAEGRLWLLNYQWQGDRELRPPGGLDPLLAAWGAGPTHARWQGTRAERLLAARVSEAGGLVLEPQAPVLLAQEAAGRNWEGAARLGSGVLLVTDEHPETLLAYVPLPR